jgi:hypothetical protein
MKSTPNRLLKKARGATKDRLPSLSLEFLHLGAHLGMIGFVSGHGFSRAEPLRKGIGL